MAQQQIKQLTAKLQAQQTEFQNYQAECKKLQEFLQEQCQKKENEIKVLKEQAIKRQKGFGQLKGQVNQLETQNASLKAQLAQLKQQAANVKAQPDKSENYKKEIQQLKNKNEKLASDYQALKQKAEKPKPEEAPKVAKGQSDADKKKLEQALAASKAKISELEKQNEKLREDLKKNSQKQSKTEDKQKKVEKDNKQEEKLRKQVEKLEKKLNQSQSQTYKAEATCIKLSKQIKQLKSEILALQSQKQSLSRKVKELNQINSSMKKQQQQMRQENEEEPISESRENTQLLVNAPNQMISALVMTKKHYASPFMEFKNDNLIQVLKSTKNGCFEKSMGTLKYKLNNISHDAKQIIQNAAELIKQNMNNGIKSSIIFYGPKKSTKKYLMSNLLSKLKEYLIGRLQGSMDQPEAVYVNSSSDPEKKKDIVAHGAQQIEQLFNKIIDIAQKSPKKTQKKKEQSKPKVRYFRFTQGQDYLEIITTSFTNVIVRESQSVGDALNNIAYSRLPNALQPLDCQRQIILTVNPIVSLYDECKNILAIANCKKTSEIGGISNENEWKEASPIKEELNDTARKKLESIERQSEQNVLKIRKQEEQISYYKGKFDQLEVRLKNLLNTHREQNTYLKKSPVTLSYEKMLKFVHSVQTKSSSSTHGVTISKYNEDYIDVAEEVEAQPGAEDQPHRQGQEEFL